MEIILTYPINTPNGEVTKLNMRRAKAGDLRKVSVHKTDADQEFYLFSELLGLPIEDLEELDLSDYKKVQEAFKDMGKQ